MATNNLTPKQERFSTLYIELGNASDAFRQAYPNTNMKDTTINRNAFKLLENNKIIARIAELKDAHVKRHNITVDDLIAELQEARDVAKLTEKAAAMVSATMGKARLLGLDKQIHELTGKDGSPIQTATTVLTPAAAKAAAQALQNDY
jgi:phage terminase small subunit